MRNPSSSKLVMRVKEGGDIATYNEGDTVQLLFDAACDRDLPLLEELVPLLETADLNFRQPFGVDGKAALHWAAHGGCLRCVRYLVEAGALVDITDTKGNTPLHSAVSNGYPYIVKYLVERGANVDARSVYLGAPLHMAAEPKPQEANLARSCLEAAKLLIKAGCDVNVCDDEGVTPLRMAESRGNEALARCLIDAGAQHTTFAACKSPGKARRYVTAVLWIAAAMAVIWLSRELAG
jgi:ankyrin repeat protein